MTGRKIVNGKSPIDVYKRFRVLLKQKGAASSSLMLLGVAVILLGLVSCSHDSNGKEHIRHSINALMDNAEFIMNDDPELALQLMDSIDSQSIRGRERQARYALLYSETLYKNGIDVDSDSLIMIAVRHYSISKDMLKRFRSYYTLGCIYNEMGHYTDATLALSEAERLAEHVNNNFRLGLLYTQFGMIYFNSYMFARAEANYEKSIHYYELAGKETHKMYALFDVARCKLELDDFDECRTILKEIMEWSIEQEDEDLYYNSLQNIMACSLYDDNVEEAKTSFDTFSSKYGMPEDDSYLLSLFANYHLLLKNYDEAQSFIDKAWECNPTVNDSANILFVESMILKEAGKNALALDRYEQSMTIQNENLRPLLQQSIMATQKDYYHNVSELESIKANRRASIIIVVIVISFLMIAIIVLYHLYNKQKLKLKIEDSLAIISDLTEKDRTNNQKIIQLDNELKGLSLTNESSNKQLEELKERLKDMTEHQESNSRQVEELNEKVRDLFSSQYASLDKLYQDMTRFQDVKHIDKATTFLNKVNAYFNEITSKSNQKNLDKIINETYNNLMVRLSDPMIGIAESDLTIIRLLLIGYSVKTIGGLTKNTPYNIYQKRHRLLTRIATTSEPLAAELRKALKMSDLNPHGGGNFSILD